MKSELTYLLEELKTDGWRNHGLISVEFLILIIESALANKESDSIDNECDATESDIY